MKGRRGLEGATWNFFGNIFRLLLQFGTGILLARLLGPSAYGPVAVVLMIIGLAQLFSDFGLSAALINAKAISHEDVNSVFTTQILLGFLLTAALIAASPLVASFFKIESSLFVIMVMSFIFLLRSFGLTSVALLSRSLDFRSAQIASLLGYILGYIIIGLPLALLGHGIWSLVFAQLAQAGSSSIYAYFVCQMRPMFTRRISNSQMMHFGFGVVQANIGSWIISNIDTFVVGRVSGPEILGLYNRALNLATIPMSAVVTSLQNVIFSITSQNSEAPSRIKDVFLNSLSVFLISAGTLLSIIASIPRTVIVALYGTKWLGAIGLLPPLSIAMVINGSLAIIGPVLMGLNKVHLENRAQWITVTISVPAITFASQYSVLALTWTVVFCYCVRMAVLLLMLHRFIGLRIGDLLSSGLVPVGIAISGGLSSALIDRFIVLEEGLVKLTLASVGGLVGAVLTGLLFWPILKRGPIGRLVVDAVAKVARHLRIGKV